MAKSLKERINEATAAAPETSRPEEWRDAFVRLLEILYDRFAGREDLRPVDDRIVELAELVSRKLETDPAKALQVVPVPTPVDDVPVPVAPESGAFSPVPTPEPDVAEQPVPVVETIPAEPETKEPVSETPAVNPETVPETVPEPVPTVDDAPVPVVETKPDPSPEPTPEPTPAPAKDLFAP